jgi:hypothetical protein
VLLSLKKKIIMKQGKEWGKGMLIARVNVRLASYHTGA